MKHGQKWYFPDKLREKKFEEKTARMDNVRAKSIYFYPSRKQLWRDLESSNLRGFFFVIIVLSILFVQIFLIYA